MSKKINFRIGVKYGIVRRILKRVSKNIKDAKVKHQRKVIYSDLKHADEELLDYLCAVEHKDLEGFVENINLWLRMEAVMTGYDPTSYTLGEGENIFKKVSIERELYFRKHKKS